jgi:hypothetical protein
MPVGLTPPRCFALVAVPQAICARHISSLSSSGM